MHISTLRSARDSERPTGAGRRRIWVRVTTVALLAAMASACVANPTDASAESSTSALTVGSSAAAPSRLATASQAPTAQSPTAAQSSAAQSVIAPSVAVRSTAFVPRAADCPAATVSVASAGQLITALAKAKPGTVIRLAPGKYVGEFKAVASGSATAPIWLCGPRTAILTTGSINTGHALMISRVSNFVAAGFSIDTAFKGVTVISGSRVAISDLAVTRIGYEGIHLRNQTVDSAVTFTTISNTGLVVDKYGEGIYVGSSEANWCSLNACQPDRTMGIVLRGNTISNTGAQPIEAKEGTSAGTIDANVVTGSSRIEPYSKSLILVKGNEYAVTGNKVNSPPLYGVQTIAADGWGQSNSFAGNTINGASGDGIWVHQPGNKGPLGNVVYCSNSAPGTRMTNITCTK